MSSCPIYQYEDSGVCRWSWTTIIILWTIVNCTPMWITIYTSRKSKPNQTEDPRFKAFLRVDLDDWSYILTLFTHFFYIPRLFISWMGIIGAFVGCALASIGHNRDQEPGPIRVWFFRNSVAVGARITLFFYGFIWLSKERTIVNYSKWLGPDYKFDARTSYKGAGTYVANH
jgi:hypothetical protein